MALAGWDTDKSFSITIDHNKIAAELTNFPILINICNDAGMGNANLTGVFTELSDSNRKKIAVATAGDLECKVEIEHWNSASEKAALWVKVPAVSNLEDTVLYLYFDSTHADNTDNVGDTGDTPAQAVWDSDFLTVHHFGQDPSTGSNSIIDSTANESHSSPGGGMDGDDLVDGLVGKGLELDGSDDNIVLDAVLSGTSTEYAAEIVWKADAEDTTEERVYTQNISSTGYMSLRLDSGGTAGRVMGYIMSDTNVVDTPTDALTLTNYNYYGLKAEESVEGEFRANGAQIDVESTFGAFDQPTDTYAHYIGQNRNAGALSKGIVSEFRLSQVYRSNAWMDVTYETLFDSLVTYAGALLEFANRIEITIDRNKIDVELTNFPILINISDSSGIGGYDLTSVFDELSDSDRKKIAVTTTTASGVEECKVEIEHWTSASGVAALWVKVPVISDIEDTVLHLYFDATHADNIANVGDTGETPAKAVWDSNYINVYHFTQPPTGGVGCIKDSTGRNDGTPAGAMTSDDLVVGQIANSKALDFDGSNDTIDISGTQYNPLGDTEVNLEIVAKIDTIEAGDTWIFVGEYQNQYGTIGYKFVSGGYLVPYIRLSSDSQTTPTASIKVTQGQWHFIGGNYKSGDQTVAHLDDSTEAIADGVGTVDNDIDFTYEIGSRGSVSGYYNESISELRYSNIKRSDAWMKTTYNTTFDSLITYNIAYVFYYTGYVQVEGSPAARTVYLYRRSTGELVGSTTSSGGDGSFSIPSLYNEYHFVNILPELEDGYNLLSYDKIHPEN